MTLVIEKLVQNQLQFIHLYITESLLKFTHIRLAWVAYKESRLYLFIWEKGFFHSNYIPNSPNYFRSQFQVFYEPKIESVFGWEEHGCICKYKSS